MNARVAFKSASFPKYQDEDAETINAHLWGKRLAEYLRDQLPNHGVATAGILCEDFGWIVEIEHEPFPLFIGCGVIDDEDDCDDANEADDAGGGGKTEIEPTPPGPVAADGPAALNAFAIFVAAEPGFFQKPVQESRHPTSHCKAGHGPESADVRQRPFSGRGLGRLKFTRAAANRGSG